MNGLAEYLCLSVKTLRAWKANSPEKLPPHVELCVGGKYDSWRFDSDVVDAWLLSNRNDKGVAL